MTNLSYSPEIITQKRAQIRADFFNISPNIKSEKITIVDKNDLQLLFKLYDTVFFEDYFSLKPVINSIHFSWSQRLTKAAGKTIFSFKKTALCVDKSYEIRMATDFFWEYDKVSREVRVCGIKTQDAVHALQIVFEHELCHLIEYVSKEHSNCHQSAFHTLAKNLFGHTEFTHQLPTKQEIAHTHYGFRVGQKVSFDFEGKKLSGVLHKIHKRAIVMVAQADGHFVDAQGRRYAKYYVSLAHLKE